MSVPTIEQELRDEAELNEYLRVVSQRVGEELAKRIDLEAFANGSEEYLQTLAATVLAVILNELGDEAIAAGTRLAEAGGLSTPTQEAIDQALLQSIRTTANTLLSDLQEQQDQVRKALDRGAGGLSASLLGGLTLALGAVLAEGARNLTGDISTDLNIGAALGDLLQFPGGGKASTPRLLKWVTMRDKRVCHEPAAPYTSDSGEPVPANAATACGGRHGVVLPASDWISEGLPRDTRLLCSRFRRPRCRCRLIAATMRIPLDPLDVQEEIKRGRAAGEAEPLELDDTQLDGVYRKVSKTLTPFVDPNVWQIKIRVHKRQRAAA